MVIRFQNLNVSKCYQNNLATSIKNIIQQFSVYNAKTKHCLRALDRFSLRRDSSHLLAEPLIFLGHFDR